MALARLIEGFRPQHYQIDLKIEPEKMVFRGRAIIRGTKVGRPSKRIALHQKNLKITSGELYYFDKKRGKLEKNVSRVNRLNKINELRVHSSEILYPGDYEIVIAFSGLINQQMHGIYAAVHSNNKKIISTQLESHHAREVFPCIDEPAAKAIFELNLDTPIGTVLSNMSPVSETVKNGRQLTSFEKSPVMSPYLLAFAFGDLTYKQLITKSGLIIRSFATKENADRLDFSLQTAAKAINFFESYFGVAYPLPKLDMLALPDFANGAMENWGLITYRESCMLIDESSSGVESRQLVALVICHEIAHQWFGNLVTMAWWDDLWLNESFANLMEYLAVDAIFPEWDIWNQFVNSEQASALKRDILPTIQPVRTGVSHPDEILTLFDPSIVYAKGGCLLRMLMHYIGEQAFKDGLGIYFEKHKYSNATADDLWSALSTAAGVDVKSFMDQWLKKPGYPVITVTRTNEAGYRISQQRLLADEIPEETTWTVPLFPVTKTSLNILTAPSAEISTKGNQPLLLNDGAAGYFVAHYQDPALFENILDSLKQGRLTLANRIYLINCYSLLERTCQAKTVENLKLLLAFENEKSEPVWGAMAGLIGSVRRLVFDTPADTAAKQFQDRLVKSVVDDIGWNKNAADDVHTLRLRELALELAVAAENQPIIEEALRRFAKLRRPNDVSSDIRGAVYFAAARFGTGEEFNKLLEIYMKTSVSEEKEELCRGLTTTKDSQQIGRLIELLNGTEIRLQDLPAWFAHLISNPYAKAQTWQWLSDNWQWLDKNFSASGLLERFPRYCGMAFSRADDLKLYKNFFEPLQSQPGLTKAIELGLQEITGKLRWRQLNEQDTVAWLLEQQSGRD